MEMRDLLLKHLPVEQRRMDVGGIQTSLLEGGRGKPLVLIHGGIQAGGLVWWRVIPHLAASHRLVVPDLPGLGESHPIPEGSLDATVRWLQELIESTYDAPPVLVAHSAPGALALRFAFDHADLIDRLILVDSGGLAANRPSPSLLFTALRSMARPSEVNLERFMRRVMYDLDSVVTAGDWPAFAGYSATRGSVRHVRQTMRRIVRFGLGALPQQSLRRVQAPVSLIWGSHDRLIPLRIAEQTSATTGWPLRVIDDTGHLPHVERPEAFVEVLTAVLGRAATEADGVKMP